MGANYSECGSGKFAEWTIPAEMQHTELVVSTSAQQSSLTPTVGKKIRVHRIFGTCTVTSALTSTVRASLSQGLGAVSNPNKVLMSINHIKGDACIALWSPSLNVLGAVNETVTLTNHTFSVGSVTIYIILYYTEV